MSRVCSPLPAASSRAPPDCAADRPDRRESERERASGREREARMVYIVGRAGTFSSKSLPFFLMLGRAGTQKTAYSQAGAGRTRAGGMVRGTKRQHQYSFVEYQILRSRERSATARRHSAPSPKALERKGFKKTKRSRQHFVGVRLTDVEPLRAKPRRRTLGNQAGQDRQEFVAAWPPRPRRLLSLSATWRAATCTRSIVIDIGIASVRRTCRAGPAACTARFRLVPAHFA